MIDRVESSPCFIDDNTYCPSVAFLVSIDVGLVPASDVARVSIDTQTFHGDIEYSINPNVVLGESLHPKRQADSQISNSHEQYGKPDKLERR